MHPQGYNDNSFQLQIHNLYQMLENYNKYKCISNNGQYIIFQSLWSNWFQKKYFMLNNAMVILWNCSTVQSNYFWKFKNT